MLSNVCNVGGVKSNSSFLEPYVIIDGGFKPLLEEFREFIEVYVCIGA